MQYRGSGGFYALAMDIVVIQHNCILDLAEQLMNTDTSEGLVKNIQLLYQYVGNNFWGEDDVMMNTNDHLHYPVYVDVQSLLFDKLLELSYRMHKDKWQKKGIGYFVPNWTTQAVLEDDINFEHYLDSLQS